VTDSLPPEATSVLAGYDVIEKEADDATLSACDALICWPRRADAYLLKKMKGLRMVQTMSAGVDALDFRVVPPGVPVFSNAGAYTPAVAEHAWGLLLGAAKGIHLRNQKSTPRAFRGKTLLIVGGGSIGSEVARLSKSLEMKTIGLSRTFRSPEFYDEMHPLSALPGYMARADAVVIALPLTKATNGIVAYDALSKAREKVVIANVGRGETVNEEDLIRWLKERPESRFATDVFWKVDGKESFSTKAWDLPNFTGTLHISGVPVGEELVGAKVAAAWNVKRYFESGAALNRVDVAEYV